jgi:DNA-binding NtrC family response regulator
MRSETSTSHADRPRALVVDDDSKILASLSKELRASFAVATAGGYDAAIRALAAGDTFAVLVTDLSLDEGRSGLDVLTEAQRRQPGCRRVLVSGASQNERVVEALTSGLVQQFVPKPWSVGDVLAAAVTLLSDSVGVAAIDRLEASQFDPEPTRPGHTRNCRG